MKPRFSYPHIVFALLATLLLAGLFYLPYLSVRTRTIETFRTQQILSAQQAGVNLQSFFSTYEKALAHLVQHPAIQDMDASGKALLENFFSIHSSDIAGIQRSDASGSILFSVPARPAGREAIDSGVCRQARGRQAPSLQVMGDEPGESGRIFFSAPIPRGAGFDGCLSFTLPLVTIVEGFFSQIAPSHDGAVLLLSREGTLLYGPDVAQIGKNLDELVSDGKDREQLRAQLEGSAQRILSLSHGFPDRSTDARNGDERYAVFLPLELSGADNWSIVMVTPAQAVLGAMAAFRWQWLLVTGVAIVAVGLLSFFLSGMVAKRREEQRVRAAEEQLAGLLDLAPLGVFLLNGNDGIVYANQEAVRMVEGTDAVTGRLLLDFLHPGDRQQVAATLRAPVAGQAVNVDGIRLLTRSRGERHLVITATPFSLGDADQRIVIFRDVTEERATEKRLQHLAAAIDQVKESVLVADRRQKIEYVNASLCALTGYAREECCGQSVDLLWADGQEAPFEAQMAKVIGQGEVWSGRIINRCKDGSLLVTAATISPVRDPLGTLTHFVAVQRDLTYEVAVESRMRQAQKMEAIGTLAGGIAHDFNNILGGIIGFTDMALLQSQPESDVHQNLLHIRQGGKRAADLVQQILTFSRQSAEEKVPVAMAPLIKESLRLLRATLSSNIDITLELAALDTMVMAAPAQIRQIVMNLCTNAFQSMREKGGDLTLRLERLTASPSGKKGAEGKGAWVSLVVADTGQGIDSESISQIFNPFFTTKQPGEGAGMGLSVVHGIVRELGGEITVASQPGAGAAFTVLLPEAEGGANNRLLSCEEPLPFGTGHVLVVDDEKEIRETYKMMLNHLGYTVTTASNPGEVMALIEQAEPRIDLVITDQTMPKMTGVVLTGNIRRRHPVIPVILCTGYSDRLNDDIAREAGACALLMKPVDLRVLGTAVKVGLQRSA
jgi:PAS domain S-box-containing protein